MTPKQAIAATERAERAYIDALRPTLQAIREKHLAPFCERHRLYWFYGHGQWFFFDADNEPREESDIERLAGGIRLLALLRVPVIRPQDDLGALLACYTGGDYVPAGFERRK